MEDEIEIAIERDRQALLQKLRVILAKRREKARQKSQRVTESSKARVVAKLVERKFKPKIER